MASRYLLNENYNIYILKWKINEFVDIPFYNISFNIELFSMFYFVSMISTCTRRIHSVLDDDFDIKNGLGDYKEDYSTLSSLRKDNMFLNLFSLRNK